MIAKLTRATMVLILDGNSDIGALVWSNIFYLSCLRYLIRTRTVKNLFFPLRTPSSLLACAACSELPSDRGNMRATQFTEYNI